MSGLRGVTCALALIGGLLIGSAAEALNFDFTNVNGGVPGQLGLSVSDGGVLAEGFDPYTVFTPKNLWLRNNPGDHGLGVCKSAAAGGTENCGTSAGPGDINELDNLNGRNEGIRLDKDGLNDWTSLFVSSLDSGGTGNSETGTLYWADTATGFVAGQSFQFTFSQFAGAVEGNLFDIGLLGAGFDQSAQFLLFVGGPCGGKTLTECSALHGNNDYLVWKGSTANVPEPGTLGLLGTALVGMAVAARRRRRA